MLNSELQRYKKSWELSTVMRSCGPESCSPVLLKHNTNFQWLFGNQTVPDCRCPARSFTQQPESFICEQRAGSALCPEVSNSAVSHYPEGDCYKLPGACQSFSGIPYIAADPPVQFIDAANRLRGTVRPCSLIILLPAGSYGSFSPLLSPLLLPESPQPLLPSPEPPVQSPHLPVPLPREFQL